MVWCFKRLSKNANVLIGCLCFSVIYSLKTSDLILEEKKYNIIFYTFFCYSQAPLRLLSSHQSVLPFSPVFESHLPTLNQQAAEDCGNPWNRRDQGCRQGATAMLECGASEEIRAASPSQGGNRGAVSMVERSGGGGFERQSEEGETGTGAAACR